MSKQKSEILDTIMNLKNNVPEGVRVPKFDPTDFNIIKTEAGKSVKGWYLGRFEPYAKEFEISAKMKGNGYMIAGDNGIVYMVPEWHNLRNKMADVQPGEHIEIEISEISAKADGEPYVHCSVYSV